MNVSIGENTKRLRKCNNKSFIQKNQTALENCIPYIGDIKIVITTELVKI